MTSSGSPDVSVLVVTHNQARYVQTALDSISAQSTAYSVEVVVADDASSDGTREIVEEWARGVEFSVNVLPPEERLGITRNYRRGFAACRGRYIAVLEGDDWWLWPDRIQRMAAALEADASLSMVANRSLFYDDETGSAHTIPSIGFESFITRVSAAEMARNSWFTTFSACMYRAGVVHALPGEVFQETAYDWLINMLVTESGDAGLLPQVMTLYRVHRGGQWSQKSRFEQDTVLRDLLPRYRRFLGPRGQAELGRAMSRLDAQLSAGEYPESAATHTLPSLRIPVPSSKTPRVSVVMPCSDHERWVAQAARSVLDQTMADLELIVVDDASSDRSAWQLSEIQDERMRTYLLGSGQGSAAALNMGIQQARSDLIAIIDPEDVWEPGKLDRQLEVLSGRPELGAVFTGVRYIDEAGDHLDADELAGRRGPFRQPNRSQAQWLRYFFENGNALCHSSVLIRRSFYERHGLYDNTLHQLADFERWITLVKHFPITVLGEEELVRFRVHDHERESGHWGIRTGTIHEYLAINEMFFDDVSNELLTAAFRDVLHDPVIVWPDERECEIAWLWWNTECQMQATNRVHALGLFRQLMKDPGTALLMRSRYGFTDRSLHALAERDLTVDLERTLSGYSSAALLALVWARMRRTGPSKWPARAMRQWRERPGQG